MFKLLMGPSNALCDRLGMTDEHERGMMRMLVNMMVISGLFAPVLYLAWRVVAKG
jgi:hypothetical protein